MKFIDIGFFLIIGYSIYDVSSNWSVYKSCDKPLQIWVLADLVILIFFKTAMQVITETENERKFKICLGFLGVLVLPSLIYWTFQGTIWLFMVEFRTPECFQDGTLGMIMYTWLFIGFCVIFLFGFIVFKEAKRYYKEYRTRHRIENLLNNLDENLLNNTDEINNLIENGLLQQDNLGLTKGEIKRLDSAILQKNQIEDLQYKECTICFDEFQQKEKVINLPGCSHTFHKECIGKWLINRPICPNCNKNVRKEIFVKLEKKI